MSSAQGTVVSINLNTPVKKRDGGTYDAWELVYRDPDNAIKTLAKPAGSLKFNDSLRQQLLSLEPGDKFTASLEKNDKGFLDVKSVTKGEFVMASPEQSGNTTKWQKSSNTYETPEERALRQRLIVRQSSLSSAITALGAGAKVDAIMKLAEQFNDFVWKEERQAAAERGVVQGG